MKKILFVLMSLMISMSVIAAPITNYTKTVDRCKRCHRHSGYYKAPEREDAGKDKRGDK